MTLSSGLTNSTASLAVKQVDVTSYVQQSGGTASFLLVRPFRNNLETATASTVAADTLNGGALACFYASSSFTSRNPKLVVQY